MPHVTLHHSAKVRDDVEVRALLGKLHNEMAAIGEFKIEDIKSRSVSHDPCIVGDGAPENSFVHVEAAIMSGRTVEKRREVGTRLLNVLVEAVTQPKISLTVEVREMERDTYFKHVT